MTGLVDDVFDVREALSRSRELMLTLAQENDELAQLIGQARSLLQTLATELERSEDASTDSELRTRLCTQAAEIVELRVRLAGYEDTRACERRRWLESQHQTLLALHAATHELLEARAPEQVYTVLFDVAVNLIGCEQAAIYRVVGQADRACLVPGMTIGLAAKRVPEQLPIDEGVLGRVVSSSEPLFPTQASDAGPLHERDISACVPLRFDERTIAVLVLYRLLEHKTDGLTRLDQRLLTMLSNPAGLALHVARLRVEPLDSQPGEGRARR
jgi:transcriptional regulator with GAF, ATPase, and Fis domain